MENFLIFNGEFPIRVLVHCKKRKVDITLFTEFWLENLTGLPLFYHRPLSKSDYIAGQKMGHTITPSHLLMYTDNSKLRHVKSSSLQLRVNNQSGWSDKFSLELDDTSHPLSLLDDQLNLLYSFVIKYETMKNVAKGSSKKISFHPKYVLINQTPETLNYKQVKIEGMVTANQYSVFHWLEPKEMKSISIRFRSSQGWSKPFSIDLLKSFSIKILNADGTVSFYSITIRPDEQNITNMVIISYQVTPELQIENQTKYPFNIQEIGSDLNCWEMISPKETKSFTFLDPESHTLDILSATDSSYNFHIKTTSLCLNNKIEFPNIPEAIYWSVQISPDGNGRVLRLSVTPSYYPIPSYLYHNHLIIGKISLSLIDKKPQEIMLITVQQLELKDNIDEGVRRYHLTLGKLQIDNQLPSTPYPVLFIPRKTNSIEPFLSITLVNCVYQDPVFIVDSSYTEILPFDIKVDEEIISRALKFKDTLVINNNDKPNGEEENEFQKIALSNSTKESKNLKLHFNSFEISAIDIDLSFLADSVEDGDCRMVPPLLRPFTNIEGTSFNLQAISTSAITTPPAELFTKIATYYQVITTKMIVSTMVGSDLLGNPKSLVSNLKSGVNDFFSEPSNALSHSSNVLNFGSAVLKGTKSLTTNSIYAITNSASKMTGSLAGIASSLDSDYQSERDWKNAREKPENIAQGTKQGLKSIGKGFLKGATGIIKDPIKGAKEGGTKGALKGFVKGTTGVVLKPTAGILDSVSKISEGIKNNVNMNQETVERVRLPRFIASDGVLRPFNSHSANILFDMQTREHRKYVHEKLYDYFELSNANLLVTHHYVILLYFDSHTEDLPIDEIQDEYYDYNAILKNTNSSGSFSLRGSMSMSKIGNNNNNNNSNSNNRMPSSDQMQYFNNNIKSQNNIIYINLKSSSTPKKIMAFPSVDFETNRKTSTIALGLSKLIEKIKYKDLKP